MIAHAACLSGHPPIADEYKSVKAVVLARVVSRHNVPETNDGFWDEGTIYTVRIDGTFRGSLGREAEIFSENSSGRFPMIVGSAYLLFIEDRHERLVVDYCGNSGPLSKRRKEVQTVKRFAAAH